MIQALTIAGSDSSGGAGIQADIKTMHANDVYAASVITSVTAQNTREVRDSFDLPARIVRAQLEAVLDDLDISAAKTGMLSSREIIETVAGVLGDRRFTQLVVDPVMISKSGYKLLQDDALAAMTGSLLPLARLVTPNIHEAEILSKISIGSLDDMREAARRVASFGSAAVIIKGGHADFAPGTDVMLNEDVFHEYKATHVVPYSVHGTGCTFSAAITARLALGEPLDVAVGNAKKYVTRVIEHAENLGAGHRTGNHSV